MNDGGAGTGEKVFEISERGKSAAFLVVLTAVVLEVADSTIVNTALPAIRSGLHATPAAMQWIVAGYLLSLGSLLLLGGRLGDAFGYSRVFLWGVGAFVFASMLCGFAQTSTQLVVARMLQGCAGAVMAPQTMAIIQILFTPLERVSRLAYFGVIVGLAAIAGPIAGGLLIELDLFGLGWRLVFLVNLPIGLGAIIIGRFVLPRDRRSGGLRLDPIGAAIFAGSFGGLLYALIEGSESGWTLTRLSLVLASLCLIAFGWFRSVSLRANGMSAIIEPALFQISTFRWGVLAAFCFSSAGIGFLLVFAVSLQQGLGLTPLKTALVHIPFGAGVMAGVGLLVPRLLPRIGKWLPVAGGVLMIGAVLIALGLMARGDDGSLQLLSCLALAGVGMGSLSGPLGPIVVAEVDRQNAGTASASLRTAQQIGGAIGIAVVGGVYFAASGNATASAGKLAALTPASLAVAAALTLAVLAVSRLPDNIFGPRLVAARGDIDEEAARY